MLGELCSMNINISLEGLSVNFKRIPTRFPQKFSERVEHGIKNRSLSRAFHFFFLLTSKLLSNPLDHF